MRFEPDRALALAAELAAPDAADRLAELFRLSGLEVESEPSGHWLAGRIPAIAPSRVVLAARLASLASPGGLSRFWRPPRPPDGTGPAVLAELARTWPRTSSRRAPPKFLAFRDESAKFGEEEHDLAIVLGPAAPGRGLVIAGTGPALELARAAVADLWIPHRVTRPGRRLRAFGVNAVYLAADAERSEVADPTTLAAFAQLATELVLRSGLKT